MYNQLSGSAVFPSQRPLDTETHEEIQIAFSEISILYLDYLKQNPDSKSIIRAQQILVNLRTICLVVLIINLAPTLLQFNLLVLNISDIFESPLLSYFLSNLTQTGFAIKLIIQLEKQRNNIIAKSSHCRVILLTKLLQNLTTKIEHRIPIYKLDIQIADNLSQSDFLLGLLRPQFGLPLYFLATNIVNIIAFLQYTPVLSIQYSVIILANLTWILIALIIFIMLDGFILFILFEILLTLLKIIAGFPFILFTAYRYIENKYKYKNKLRNFKKISVQSDEKCSICISLIKGLALQLPCSHFFHEKCLEEWLKVQQVCPICRSVT